MVDPIPDSIPPDCWGCMGAGVLDWVLIGLEAGAAGARRAGAARLGAARLLLGDPRRPLCEKIRKHGIQ